MLLIEALYKWTSKNKILSKQRDFLNCFLEHEFADNHFSRNYKNEFKKDLIYIKDNKAKVISLLQDNYVDLVQKAGKLDQLKHEITRLLQTTTKHDAERANYLIQYLSNITNKENDRWSQFLYYFIYFAMSNRLHPNLGFESYLHLRTDIDDYTREVIMAYGGNCGDPGMAKVLELAQTENVIALYEVGEAYYYGKIDGKRDFQKALEYYNKILDLNANHPMALWSRAYMMYSYGQGDLKNAYIEEFEQLRLNESAWYTEMITCALKAYIFDSGAAANLLGKMIEEKNGAIPEAYRKSFPLKSALDFYRESSENGYAFGANNAYDLLRKESETESDPVKAYEKASEAYDHLKKSAKSFEPWACNTLARRYKDGWKAGIESVVDVDKEEAFIWFEKGNIIGRRKGFFWPILNLIEFFYSEKSNPHYKEISFPKQLILVDEVISKSTDKGELETAYNLKAHIEKCFDEECEKLEANRNKHKFACIEPLFSKENYRALFMRYSPDLEKDGQLYKRFIQTSDPLMNITPGMAVAFGNEKQHYTFCRGKVSKKADSTYVTEDTLFDISSLTKFFLPLIMIQLEKEGLLKLRDPISKYRLGFPNLPADITFEDLLSFEKIIAKTETIKKLGFMKANEALKNATFHYVDKPEYIDINAMVLQKCIEDITKKSYGEIFDSLFVQKLGLKNTFYKETSIKPIKNRMDYSDEIRFINKECIPVAPPKGFAHDEKTRELCKNGQRLLAHAGLFMSAEDIVTVSQAILAEKIVPYSDLKRIVDGLGYNEPEPEKRTFGFQAYRKHFSDQFNEIPQMCSNESIAISGFTGCYWLLDFTNKCFVFIGGNKINQCLTKISDDSKDDFAETYEYNGKVYAVSVKYPYLKDELMNLLASYAICM